MAEPPAKFLLFNSRSIRERIVFKPMKTLDGEAGKRGRPGRRIGVFWVENTV
jgi:hypothetical protein